MNIRQAVTLLSFPLKQHAVAMFAVTNACNARCSFCAIWKQRPRRSPRLTQATSAIDALYDLGIRHIQFTGGEPFLYPHLPDLIAHATRRGIYSSLVTNGSLVTRAKVEALSAGGLSAVGVSVDHHDPSIVEAHRHIADLSRRIRTSVQLFKSVGIPTQASTTISKLLSVEDDDVRKLIELNTDLGFDGTYFCYPMVEMYSSYTIGGDSVEFSPQELRQLLVHLIELKEDGYPIDNTLETLQLAVDFVDRKDTKYPCLGGYKVFYVDWNLDLFGCMSQDDRIGSIIELDTRRQDFRRNPCNKCLLSCYREPSIYYHGIRSIAPGIRLLRAFKRRSPIRGSGVDK